MCLAAALLAAVVAPFPARVVRGLDAPLTGPSLDQRPIHREARVALGNPGTSEVFL